MWEHAAGRDFDIDSWYRFDSWLFSILLKVLFPNRKSLKLLMSLVIAENFEFPDSQIFNGKLGNNFYYWEYLLFFYSSSF